MQRKRETGDAGRSVRAKVHVWLASEDRGAVALTGDKP